MNRELDDEIHEQFLIYKSKASPQTLAEFAALPSNDLILCHFGLGLYVRNNHLHTGSKLHNLFLTASITCMDTMSDIIIRAWHRVLSEELQTTTFQGGTNAQYE